MLHKKWFIWCLNWVHTWVWFTFGMGYFVAVFGLIATAEPVTFDTEENKKVEAIRPGVTDGNGTIIE